MPLALILPSKGGMCVCIFIYLFIHLTYSRWTSSLPSCLWSLRIFPSLPGSRLTIFYRDASSALSQLVNQWLNFTYSRSHAFRYERKNPNPTLVRIEFTTSALAGVQVTYETTGATRYVFIKLHIIVQHGHVIYSFYATACNPPGESFSQTHSWLEMRLYPATA